MDDHDGDLSNVNPDLLKLCANADDWREQRRRAMKAKIFGGGHGGGSEGEALSSANAYLPSDGTTAGPSPPSSAAGPIPPSQQASEAYILQQILSHKRRRDEANQQSANPPINAGAASFSAPPAPPQQQRPQHHQQPPPPQSEGELSLREKLMRKYHKN
ncbi:hypothetical protein ABB37_04943 [Leptomonas pyrrhocoris]|uniref:Uncharacterized protein n=1 Tax=Leptomonas pyrrhocoris TaxID=157538 RepID=A0A0M9G0T4_LEPPY|nr:hypothetical protein ABB37_04943 [Leptomonas pyrrhocoris]XP_015658306.1 hypothetical protein ABB37_04943 [Leptomonas pyrrhocoris]XP_015658307.1 hypothetical protein ABB37_04943 [Leptomonas pyrrhocoris]KPA79866.1 hypothetical protein ABB37_04943 [Leptomonas pyrrhocoris]KPA79867.1 hypothetical protein ABB37_04943 [Leptomonas pyrrhocoris]KPA79868.1 hypothetical protein ABB37_04943 [Leptomonas pyrrhocoris]|eukprot:XP_015658305.1 hypothetical protein ABB37_04943 [Leptomonas pyrrhocoris]